MEDNKLYQNAVKQTLLGASIYVRDINLNQNHIAKYKQGMIILEKAFVDASCNIASMQTTHRYTIISNHMKDFRPYEQGTNWGLFVANRNSRFKILDIYEYERKTQILLLHLINDDNWNMFENKMCDAEIDLVNTFRKDFENKCIGEIVPELATAKWLERCNFPLGMNDKGELFDLEFNLENLMNTIKDTNFRKLYHKIVYIRCPELLEKVSEVFPSSHKDNGVLAYGYIDEEAGFSFRVLCTAGISDSIVNIGKANQEVLMIIRRGNVNENLYLDMTDINIDKSIYYDTIEQVNRIYSTKNKDKELMRNIEELDSCRSLEYPDDISVVLIREELQMEQIWVRCTKITEDKLFGTALNEPYQNYGIHKGDTIDFIIIKHNGGFICVNNTDD